MGRTGFASDAVRCVGESEQVAFVSAVGVGRSSDFEGVSAFGFEKGDGLDEVVFAVDGERDVGAEEGEVGFGLDEASAKVFGDFGFETSVGVTGFSWEGRLVLRGVFAVFVFVVFYDFSAELIVNGSAVAFVKCIPYAKSAGEDAAGMAVIIGEYDTQTFACGTDSHGDAGRRGTDNEEITNRGGGEGVSV